MEFRSLTPSEIADLEHIIYDEVEVDTLQILFGMIALDLNISFDKFGKIKYQYLCDNYADSKPNYGPTAYWGIIETWIKETMIYNNEGIAKDIFKNTKKIEENINSIAAILSYTVCQINSGISGKRDRDVINFFVKINHELLNANGYSMDKLPTETFRFIVSCIEYFGFRRKEKTDSLITVDVSMITYDDLI